MSQQHLEAVETKTTGSTWQAQDGMLLEVDGLHVEFRTRYGVAKAINGVILRPPGGRDVAVLGESGSGKSVTAQAIMGILDTPPGFITGGEIRYCGTDILKMPEESGAGDPRPGDLDGLPGRAQLAEPGVPGRLADRGDVPPAPRDEQVRLARAGRAADGAGARSPAPSSG